MVTGSSKILLEFILEIVCVCRTDGQTDERTSKTRNAAYWDGRIIMTASAEVKRRRRLCFWGQSTLSTGLLKNYERILFTFRGGSEEVIRFWWRSGLICEF